MGKLVNITEKTPTAVQIWGFHGTTNGVEIEAALGTIAGGLSGDKHTIDVMGGTHGYCSGKVGAVERREEWIAEMQRSLAHPKTKDGKAITVTVHDFNNDKLPGPDYVTSAMSKLNTDMRSIVTGGSGTHTFLLAYCCSAGTE